MGIPKAYHFLRSLSIAWLLTFQCGSKCMRDVVKMKKIQLWQSWRDIWERYTYLCKLVFILILLRYCCVALCQTYFFSQLPWYLAYGAVWSPALFLEYLLQVVICYATSHQNWKEVFRLLLCMQNIIMKKVLSCQL